MTSAKRDPLLTAGRLLTIFMMSLMGLGVIIMTVLIPVILFNQGWVVAEIAAEHPEAAGASLIGPIVALLLICIAAISLSFLFMRNLLHVINSVAEGDPFAPANGDRLARMGWLGLAVQIVAFPATALAGWVSEIVEDAEINADFSLTGVLLIIILFILARVFRHGAEMRDDLEGTV